MDIILKQVEKRKKEKKGELCLIGRTLADTIGSDLSSIFLYIFVVVFVLLFVCLLLQLCFL